MRIDKSSINEKANRILEKQRKEYDGDKHVKKCLKAYICPWCGKELIVNPIGLPGYYLGTDYYCKKCNDHIDDFLYYTNSYVESRIKRANRRRRK